MASLSYALLLMEIVLVRRTIALPFGILNRPWFALSGL